MYKAQNNTVKADNTTTNLLYGQNAQAKHLITFSRGMARHEILRNIFGDHITLRPKKCIKNALVAGWGNKSKARAANAFARKHDLAYVSLEDGFIRSVGLGVDDSPPFSLVVDDLGIYYDATRASRLEKILSEYDFNANRALMETAEKAIQLIARYKVSKYNAAPELRPDFFANNGRKKVLVIAQTRGDLSLTHGNTKTFSPNQLIRAAIAENPGADVYIKLHPDVLAGKKKSDIDPSCFKTKIKTITHAVNPISLMENVDKVYTKTSQMGFDALLLGKPVVCFGMPFYAGWGLTDDRVPCPRRNRKLSFKHLFAGACILYPLYCNPFTHQKTDILDTVYTIKKYSDINLVNRGILVFFGFTWWKQNTIKKFFKSYGENQIHFCSSLEQALKRKLNRQSKFFIWSQLKFDNVKQYADRNNIPVFRVEDGFIRSVALGSDLNCGYSLVVDSRGLYIDPTSESDLEHILNTYDFKNHTGLLPRADAVIDRIKKNGFSKYNCLPHKKLEIKSEKNNKRLLVVGQVGDDASILFGGYGMTNSDLITTVRKNNPTGYIVYKPHPDVLAGNRAGALPDEFVYKYCDRIVKNRSIGSCIEYADEIHTITSLCGFDALLRSKKAFTYGMPFYAGWGLTEDRRVCKRRRRKLSLRELVAGALLIYPRYLHPETGEFCELGALLDALEKEQQRYFSSAACRLSQNFRDWTIRKVRRAIDGCMDLNKMKDVERRNVK
ncbi:MAG: capsular polysaccharide biosynthesis protein [Thermodesulfobacteriota bacterium]|nr:capsular polysaccharide biosynthesis protein [Thermodesulfobacteriota bacterium]